ncbi:hypothetical protein Baya_6704 [Bagarius yarrelli]|uniref:Uncharacterized protein n=1 Tax=Bagarius yarrelli TaxID=175774 RepID=A0A556U1P0_BAGYA|nr:hypothetical protein Baya_6704 [Bagarius yarrelli]
MPGADDHLPRTAEVLNCRFPHRVDDDDDEDDDEEEMFRDRGDVNPDTSAWRSRYNPTSSRQVAAPPDTFIAARRSTYQLGHIHGSV